MSEKQAVYGIIGNPVEHSLSPLMHNAAFKELEVAACYKLFPLEENELDEFFEGLKQEDSEIFGLNVTVPYKERVMKYMDHFSSLAQKISAVNTIVISKDRKLKGYNTDAPGFMSHVQELGFDTSDKQVAILGAGGSARAIIVALCIIPERPAKIKIYNRTFARLEKMLDEISEQVDISIIEPVASIEELSIRTSDLIINATSIGLRSDDPILVSDDEFNADQLVYDLIYNPQETELLKQAKSQGARIANGLGMLFYQGVLSFQHWADVELDEEVKSIMRKYLEEGLSA